MGNIFEIQLSWLLLPIDFYFSEYCEIIPIYSFENELLAVGQNCLDSNHDLPLNCCNLIQVNRTSLTRFL